MLIDTHCHIYKQYYENIDEIIKKAKVNGVGKIINNACNLETSQEVLNLATEYDALYASIGIHPQNVDDQNEGFLDYLEKNILSKEVVAIGEIGLDYYWTKDNKNKQIYFFEEQLKLAEKYNLPVIIHSREATSDVLRILKKYRVCGIIHAFCGSYEVAREFIEMGFLLGIGGVITFKNSKLCEVVSKLSLSNIVLETDSPFLTPEPCRGQKNEPAYVKNIAEYLSNLFHIPLSEVEKITNQNIKQLFDI